MFPIDMDPLFLLLEMTRGIEQKEEHHPEGDVFNHSLQVLYYAFSESNDTDLILAAMLHDVGKTLNVRGHDNIASEWLRDLTSTKTQWLVKQHMRVWCFLLGEMRKKTKVRELAEHPWLPELIQLARWDKMGRNPHVDVRYDRGSILEKLDKCSKNHFKKVKC